MFARELQAIDASSRPLTVVQDAHRACKASFALVQAEISKANCDLAKLQALANVHSDCLHVSSQALERAGNTTSTSFDRSPPTAHVVRASDQSYLVDDVVVGLGRFYEQIGFEEVFNQFSSSSLLLRHAQSF